MDEDRKRVEIVYGGITLREALKVVAVIMFICALLVFGLPLLFSLF